MIHKSIPGDLRLNIRFHTHACALRIKIAEFLFAEPQLVKTVGFTCDVIELSVDDDRAIEALLSDDILLYGEER